MVNHSKPERQIRWESVLAILVPTVTLGAYGFAYFYEVGYLQNFGLNGPITKQYIVINWNIFIPILLGVAMSIMGVMIWMIPSDGHTKPFLVRKMFGGMIDVPAITSTLYIYANLLSFLLPSKWISEPVGQILNIFMYVASFVLIACLLRAIVRYLAKDERVLFDFQSKATNWLLAIFIMVAAGPAVCSLGSAYGQVEAMKGYSYQVLTDTNKKQYAVIRHYGSNYVTVQLDKNRETYIFPDDSLSVFRLERTCVKNLQDKKRMQIQPDCPDQ